MIDGKDCSWIKVDEEGRMRSVLDKMARCPYCGRFMRRGLLNFLEHTWGDCPHHIVFTYSPKEDDITQPNK